MLLDSIIEIGHNCGVAELIITVIGYDILDECLCFALNPIEEHRLNRRITELVVRIVVNEILNVIGNYGIDIGFEF